MLENELNDRKRIHPVLSLLFILFLVGFGFIVGGVAGLTLSSLYYGGTEDDLIAAIQRGDTDPELKYVLFLTQVCAAIMGLFLAPYIFLRTQQLSLRTMFKVGFLPGLIILLVALIVIFSFGPNSILMEWNQNIVFPEFLKSFEDFARKLEDDAAMQTKLLTSFETVFDLALGILVIAIIPAIGEELVFRGIVQNELFRGTKNIHISIWVTGILFSAIHFQFYGFIPRALLGVLFGYLYHWSGNLSVPIFAHFVNNAFQVFALYLYQAGDLNYDVEATESLPIPAVVVSTVMTAGLLFYFYKYFESRNPQTHPL